MLCRIRHFWGQQDLEALHQEVLGVQAPTVPSEPRALCSGFAGDMHVDSLSARLKSPV